MTRYWAASDLEVAGVADTGQQAIHQVAALTPHVVLMDLQMPDMDGIAATAQLKATHPDVHVLVLSTSDGHTTIQLPAADQDALHAVLAKLHQGAVSVQGVSRVRPSLEEVFVQLVKGA